jgi:aerobic-type carbon monoxide dehydrogenase small subunit (CoxS/CutS family)
MDSSLILKVALGDDLRRIPVPAPSELSYSSLCCTLGALFPSLKDHVGLAVQYVDDEGDSIVASSDAELSEAFRVALEDNRKSLRLDIIVKGPTRARTEPVIVASANAGTASTSMVEVFKRAAEKSMAVEAKEGVTAPPVTTSITFVLNNEHVTVHNPDPRMRLIEYLREQTRFTGTKISCAEGGCGACTVMLTSEDGLARSVNACLRPLIACDGQTVTTTEGIGDKNKYHPVQKALAEGFGLQCGFCTPGMVMAMYSLMQEKGSVKPTPQEVEDRFDGNICRCTGYRPILQSFRKLAAATDAAAASSSDTTGDADAAATQAGGCCGGKKVLVAKTVRPSIAVAHVPSAGSGASATAGAKYYRCASLAEVIELKNSMLSSGTPVQTMVGNTSHTHYTVLILCSLYSL